MHSRCGSKSVCVCVRLSVEMFNTYIMFPDNFVCGRICMHFAFEIDIVAFLDVFRIQVRAQLQQ